MPDLKTMSDTDETALEARDLADARGSFLLIWGLPIAGLILGGVADLEAFFWPPALLVMGVGCVINAFRCRRLHCFLTGPFFIFCAIAAFLFGAGQVDFGPDGWSWIGGVVLIGGLGLTYLPEMIWGRFVRR